MLRTLTRCFLAGFVIASVSAAPNLDFSSHLRHKRPHECGRGTQECVRHVLIRQPAFEAVAQTPRVCRVGTFQKARECATCIPRPNLAKILRGNTPPESGKKASFLPPRDAPEGPAYRSCRSTSR